MDYETKMEILILQMRSNESLTSLRVENAVRENPRHLFLSDSLSSVAYVDNALPTKDGQTISQPSTVVRMTELLDVRPGQKVLEIGTGSGWQSAILATLVGPDGDVFSIERKENLVTLSKQNLEKVRRVNVHIKQGDGSIGYPDAAPYDRIIVTAAVPSIPHSLIHQLKKGGKMVVPVGETLQEMRIIEKKENGEILTRKEGTYVFVPLVGKEGFLEKGEA